MSGGGGAHAEYAVRAVSEEEWESLRAVRLQALAESPASFGSTLAGEQALTEDVWRERARGSATTRLFIAWTEAGAAGLTGVVDEKDGSVQLVSVWVNPLQRRRGVARALTTAALRFARGRGFALVRLWVTDGNAGARTLYEHLGFTSTGRRQPLPSDPRFDEHELKLELELEGGHESDDLQDPPTGHHPMG